MASKAEIAKSFEAAYYAFRARDTLVRKDRFLAMDAAARDRAWTVARIADLDMMSDVRDAIDESLRGGMTYRDFIDRMRDVSDQYGWTGMSPRHQELVYTQNINMAYAAGKYQQLAAAGVHYWRKLPSTAKEPREDHAEMNEKIFPLNGAQPPPPWDFGCQCEYEAVFDDELEGIAVEPGLQVAQDLEFQWHPKNYMADPLSPELDDYPRDLADAYLRSGHDNPPPIRERRYENSKAIKASSGLKRAVDPKLAKMQYYEVPYRAAPYMLTDPESGMTGMLSRALRASGLDPRKIHEIVDISTDDRRIIATQLHVDGNYVNAINGGAVKPGLPLMVEWKGAYYVLDGHHALTAAKLARAAKIAVKLARI